MATKFTRITIYSSSSGKYYNLFKVFSYKSGGIGLLLPSYDSAQMGRLGIMNVDYGSDNEVSAMTVTGQQYRASDIVKFSYHLDGFVQFSSATNYKIVSGLDIYGKPKGLGIRSWPLSKPISSGPSMTLALWGVNKLKETDTEKVDNRYVFETAKASSYQSYKPKNGDDNLFGFNIFVIPDSIKGQVFEVNGREYAHLVTGGGQFPNNYIRSKELIRVIRIPGQEFYLGISFICIEEAPNRFKFGYNFCGPSDGKQCLFANYPEGSSYYNSTGAVKKLDFNPNIKNKSNY